MITSQSILYYSNLFIHLSLPDSVRVSQKVKSWLNYLSSYITVTGSLASLSSIVKGEIIIALASEQIFKVFPFVM